MPIRLPKNPPLVEVPVTHVLWRVHKLSFGPVWFGPVAGHPPEGRFDAPGGEFGMCYFGATLGVAILETLVRNNKSRLIPRSELKLRGGSTLSLTTSLRMLQLEGKGLASFGLSADKIAGNHYAACQDLARRLYHANPDIDGIQYRSRWDTSELCWALFDRAKAKLSRVLGTQCLDDPAVWGPALIPYKNVLVI